VQEAEGPLAVDRVGSVEKLDFRPLADAKFVVMTTNLCVFPRHPFVECDAISMAAFDHERPWRHEIRQLRVVGDVPHVPLEDFVLLGEDVRRALIARGVLFDPVVEIAGADRKTVLRHHRRDAHGRLAAVGKTIKRNATGIDPRQRAEPFNLALVLRDDIAEQ
jgi:hypothetical protein